MPCFCDTSAWPGGQTAGCRPEAVVEERNWTFQLLRVSRKFQHCNMSFVRNCGGESVQVRMLVMSLSEAAGQQGRCHWVLQAVTNALLCVTVPLPATLHVIHHFTSALSLLCSVCLFSLWWPLSYPPVGQQRAKRCQRPALRGHWLLMEDWKLCHSPAGQPARHLVPPS